MKKSNDEIWIVWASPQSGPEYKLALRWTAEGMFLPEHKHKFSSDLNDSRVIFEKFLQLFDTVASISQMKESSSNLLLAALLKLATVSLFDLQDWT